MKLRSAVLSYLAASYCVALIFTGNPFVCRARWEFQTPCNVSAAAAVVVHVNSLAAASMVCRCVVFTEWLRILR